MELKTITQTFTVAYTYQLQFTQGIFEAGNNTFVNLFKNIAPEEPIKLLFVIDDGVLTHHTDLASQIKAYCFKYSDSITYTKNIVIKGGEYAKHQESYVAEVLQEINENAICRHSFVVAIGGGAVIDMAGYAAAIAHRGVKFIRIPTTVLAQNDAAVGVKNGVNAFKKKNFLGTFSVPFAIINDTNFLSTLAQRDWISGIAEAIKVALIKDASFFHYIVENALALRNRDMPVMQQVIHKCAGMHMEHISQGGDPFEQGSSRPLDFGHWAAHKLEYLTTFDLRHGEAVAKGIALDVTYAHLLGLISKEALSQIWSVLEAIGFDISLPVNNKEDETALLVGIEEFREHLGGKLTITLIAGIGIKHDVHSIDMNLMRQSIGKLNAFANSKK